ncbi:hypothetical protein O1L55_16290 [Streptomyces albulus]|nr:hypothetical protein [Streptomyces noursei]
MEILEQGRGILLARTLGLHGGGGASGRRPALADRLAALRAALDTVPTGADPADRRHQLADAWELAVAEARRLPGLEGFLKPPRLATLRLAAAGGPVVTVNTSPLRCDALILTTGEWPRSRCPRSPTPRPRPVRSGSPRRCAPRRRTAPHSWTASRPRPPSAKR